MKRTVPQFQEDDEMKPNGIRLGWVVVLGAALVGFCAFAIGGCYVVPIQDDPYTDFDESSEEALIAGARVLKQPAGTGAWLSEPIESDPWWLTGLQIVGTFMGGNLAFGLASVVRGGSRGQSNLKNLFRMKSTWGSTVKSAAALVLPTASPPEAVVIAAADTKAVAADAALASKAANA